MVWSGRLRALHWALALAVSVLVATGWLMGEASEPLAGRAAEVHRNVGSLLLVALAARIYLLFAGRGPERWRDFVPWPPQHRAALAVLRFYLTLGRSPLPAYYARNPLWGPVELAFYVFLLVQGWSGLAGAGGVHGAGLAIALGFALAHVLGAVLHDWKGTGADVSAMINGHRVFIIGQTGPARPPGVQAVSVEALTRSRPSAGR